MKKIIFIIDDLTVGGLERVVVRYCELLRDAGVAVALISERGAHGGEFPTPCGAERISLEGRRGKSRAEMLTEVARTRKPDLVVHEEYFLKPGVLQADIDAIHAAGVPCAVHHHSAFINMLHRPGRVSDFYELIPVYQTADALIVISKANDAFYSALGCKTFLLPNPVSDVPLRQKVPAEKSVLWIGHFLGLKRPLDAIRIFERVLMKVPDATMTMLGSLSGEEGSRVARYVRRSSTLRSAVELKGFRKDVEAYLSAAAVLLVTSEFEGDPCVVMEAKAHALPIVCYDLPYVDSIRNGIGVLRVSQRNVDAAAEAVVGILADRASGECIGRDGRRDHDQRRSLDHVKEMMSLFNRIRSGGWAAPICQDDVWRDVVRTMVEHLRHPAPSPSPWRRIKGKLRRFL